MHPLHGIHILIMLTHNFMYANVYTCTHCGRTGHLTKVCYDKINILNFANKFVWVRKCANLQGPKKIWVQKFTLFHLLYVWAFTRRESISTLMVNAFRTQRSHFMDALLSRKFWWEGHQGLEK